MSGKQCLEHRPRSPHRGVNPISAAARTLAKGLGSKFTIAGEQERVLDGKARLHECRRLAA